MTVGVRVLDVLDNRHEGDIEVEAGHPIVSGLGGLPALLADHLGESVPAPLKTVTIALRDDRGAMVAITIRYPVVGPNDLLPIEVAR